MKIAVIGSGISGLSAAWLLRKQHEVTLFESQSRLGGHTNSVDVDLDGTVHPVDTGFLVYNELTYPNLVALFHHLGIETHPTEMSFSVKLEQQKIEWAGSNLSTVFGQKRNLVRPGFWRMLQDMLRFNRHAVRYLGEAEHSSETLGELLDRERYSDWFMEWYLVPMAAAIWSASPANILKYPASSFLRFCINHRLLQVNNRPVWRSVVGGARQYVDKMAASLNYELSCPVHEVHRDATGVRLKFDYGEERFDRVIFATHAPDTLSMLADASDIEREILGAVGYQSNLAILHTDASTLPGRRSLWSAWNYSSTQANQPVCVTYWLNELQQLPFRTPLLVTLNPPANRLPAGEIRRFHYDHPVFNQSAIEAQQRLTAIQGQGGAWYCGAWCGYGFHEDGLKSTLRILPDFDVQAPWEVNLWAA